MFSFILIVHLNVYIYYQIELLLQSLIMGDEVAN